MPPSGSTTESCVFTTRTGLYFWLHIAALAVPAMLTAWYFIQPPVMALLSALLIIILNWSVGAHYAKRSKWLNLIYQHGEWRIMSTVPESENPADRKSENISLLLPVIRLPNVILLSYSTRNNRKQVITLWRDTIGEKEFRQLSRLLAREAFLLTRS